MKKIFLSVQNNLLSEAIQNALVRKGRFCIENVSPNQDGEIKEHLPNCKTALLCDEQSYPDLADRVKQAKQFGKISSFFYSSVTADYLAAALDAL